MTEKDMMDGIRKAYKELDAYFDTLVEECDPEMKLAVTRWAMKHIVNHAREGGTYRYLIYDRLGFDASAYGILLSDGMTISNEFDLNYKENIQEVFKTILQDEEGDLDLLKMKLESLKYNFTMCDEKGCCEEAACGFPTDSGYRRTCGEHYRQYGKK
jgi:hypothetical protein